MALFAAATITTIGMTNTRGNGIGLLLVEAQQQQNVNGVSMGNCVTIGDNTTLGSSVTIGDNSTIAKNMRIDENVSIGENITMTSGGQMDGNASSPITSPQNATAVPVNTQINIAKAVAKPTIVLYLVMMDDGTVTLDGIIDRMDSITSEWEQTGGQSDVDIIQILSKPLLCSKFTDGKGITDTATVNFVFTIENEEI